MLAAIIKTLMKITSRTSIISPWQVTMQKIWWLPTPRLRWLAPRVRVFEKKGYTNYSAFLIELYERYTYPFAIVILTFIAVVVSSRKSREGVGAQIVLGIVLAFVYILLLMAGRSFTQDDTFHPLLSAWLPNLVFIVIGAILYRTVPK